MIKLTGRGRNAHFKIMQRYHQSALKIRQSIFPQNTWVPFHCILNYSVKSWLTRFTRLCYMEWSRNLCPWSAQCWWGIFSTSVIFAESLPMCWNPVPSGARSWDGEQGLIPGAKGVEPYGMPLLPLGFSGSQMWREPPAPQLFPLFTPATAPFQ